MKSIIDGTLYDTEEATKLARHYIRELDAHYGFERETLYKAGDGTYLIHYQKARGLPNHSVVRAEEMPIDEESLHQVDAETVIDWCEQRGVVNDEIIDEFGGLLQEP